MRSIFPKIHRKIATIFLLSIFTSLFTFISIRWPDGIQRFLPTKRNWENDLPTNQFGAICTRNISKCIPPFRPFEKRFRMAPRYKMNYCAIEKNVSTILTAIFCFLFNEERFREMRREINTEFFHKRLCKQKNEAFSMAELAEKSNQSMAALEVDWLHLAVVRHPLDRFLSAFVDKCVLEKSWLEFPLRCNGCRNNMSCFIRRQHERMQRYAYGKERLNSFDDRRCQFNEHFRHFTFLHYSPTSKGVEQFFTALFHLFRMRGVQAKSIEFIANQTRNGRTRHSTWQKRQRKKGEQLLRENKGLLEMLVRMYYYDFVLFGFPIPL